jgi:signal peptidase I
LNSQDDASQNPVEPESGQKQEAKREVIEFFKLVFYFLILFIGLRWYAIEGYEVQGPSMQPTLQDGERILVFKLPHILSQWPLFGGIEALKQGDIVVFQSPDDHDKRYVKRVIAKGLKHYGGKTVSAKQHDDLEPPEDTIGVKYDRGNVYIDQHRLIEGYIVPEENQHTESYEEVRLGPGDYYVLGDYRDISKDSRTFGPIQDEKIIGKAVLRFWPLSKFGFLH